MNESRSYIVDEPFFDRETTDVLKGIALLLMSFHHFFTFPSWWVDGVSYPGMAAAASCLCAPAKICVPIFCFITGYFYHYHKKKTYGYSIRKITDLLISYWMVLFIFSALAICILDSPYTVKSFISEFALNGFPTMIFCWYVRFYVACMLVLPLMTRVMGKRVYIDLVIAFILFPVACICLLRIIPLQYAKNIVGDLKAWTPIVLLGWIFARYDCFPKMDRMCRKILKNKQMMVIMSLLAVLLVPMGRQYAPTIIINICNVNLYISMDALYTPVFIYMVVYLCKTLEIKYIKAILVPIGKYSLLMWFTSCIFFGNCKSVFQPVLYYSHYPILVMIWGNLMCYAASVVLQIGIKRMQMWKNKMLFCHG